MKHEKCHFVAINSYRYRNKPLNQIYSSHWLCATNSAVSVPEFDLKSFCHRIFHATERIPEKNTIHSPSYIDDSLLRKNVQ